MCRTKEKALSSFLFNITLIKYWKSQQFTKTVQPTTKYALISVIYISVLFLKQLSTENKQTNKHKQLEKQTKACYVSADLIYDKPVKYALLRFLI